MAAASQEKQSQSKPILKRMNVNFCATGYYESKPAIRVAGKPTFAVRKGSGDEAAFSENMKNRQGRFRGHINRFLDFAMLRIASLGMTVRQLDLLR